MASIIHEYQTIYGFTLTTLITTTISVSSTQSSATIYYPDPPITAPQSFITITISPPNTFNSLFPPQSQVVLPVLVLTDVVGIAVSSGIPIQTRTLIQKPPAAQSAIFDLQNGFESDIGRADSRCISWDCWTTAQRIGTATAFSLVGLIVVGLVLWRLCCRKKRSKSQLTRSNKMRSHREKLVDAERARQHFPAKHQKHPVRGGTFKDESDVGFSSIPYLGRASDIAKHGSTSSRHSVPAVRITTPKSARSPQQFKFEEAESPTQRSAARDNLSGTCQISSQTGVSPSISNPSVGGKWKNECSSTLGVVGSRLPSTKGRWNVLQGGILEAATITNGKIGAAATMVEDMTKAKVLPERGDFEAPTGDGKVSRVVVLGKEIAERAAPIIKDLAQKPTDTHLERIKDKVKVPRNPTASHRMADQMTAPQEEMDKPHGSRSRQRRAANSVPKDKGNIRGHKRGRRSHKRGKQSVEKALQAKKGSTAEDFHLAGQERKRLDWSSLLYPALKIILELWESRDGRKKPSRKPKRATTKQSTRAHKPKSTGGNEPYMMSTLKTPQDPSQASTSHSSNTSALPTRKLKPSHKTRATTPDSYISCAPEPIKQLIGGKQIR